MTMAIPVVMERTCHEGHIEYVLRLIPQCVLAGLADAIGVGTIMEFIYTELLKSLSSLGMSLSYVTAEVASLVEPLLVKGIVGKWCYIATTTSG